MFDSAYAQSLGQEAYELLEDLFPLPRSLTGNGVRRTLDRLEDFITLRRFEIPTGTEIFDWVIPNEWNLNEATLYGPDGEVVVSTKDTNLHVVGYSEPVSLELPLEELRPHIHTRAETPDAIPYITSYYKRAWGFCMSQNMADALAPGNYRVEIDTVLEPGSMTLADCVLPGESEEEILFNECSCHPSMANDNLSSIVVLTLVLRELAKRPNRHYTIRGIFAPETLGVIAYLHEKGAEFSDKTRAGITASCVGARGEQGTLEISRDGAAEVDKLTEHLLKSAEIPHRIIDFVPIGSDERQYSSPGFNLPVASLMRTYYYDWVQYHTSDDNLDAVTPESLGQMAEIFLRLVDAFEMNRTWVRTDGGFCEPQLGKRGLYPSTGSVKGTGDIVLNTMWALNLADGKHDTLAMAERAGIPIWEMYEVLKPLVEGGMITEAS